MGLVPASIRFIKEANTTVTVQLLNAANDVIETIGLQPDKDIRVDEQYRNHIIVPINTSGGHANNKFLVCPWEKIDFVNSSPSNAAPTTVDGAMAILMKDFFFELGGGGGSSLTPIDITILGLQALIAGNNVQNGIYHITDLENGGWFEGIAPNIINPQGTVSILLPDYSSAPQLLPSDTVTTGELYSWGNLMWEALITGAITPPASQFDLDPAEFSLVPKNVSNGYLPQIFISEIDVVNVPGSAFITSLTQYAFKNQGSQSTPGQLALGLSIFNSWYNTSFDALAFSNVNSNLNNRVLESDIEHNEGDGQAPFIHSNEILNGAIVRGNTGANSDVSGNLFSGSNVRVLNNSLIDSSCKNNQLEDESSIVRLVVRNGEANENLLTLRGNISDCQILSTCSINGNQINAGNTNATPQIGFCILNDNCHIDDNVISGDSSCIWNIWSGENSDILSNSLLGSQNRISDITQTQFDKIEGCVLSGDQCRIETIYQEGYSTISKIKLEEDLSFLGVMWIRGKYNHLSGDTTAYFRNFTINSGSGKLGYNNINVINSVLENGEDFNISDCTFEDINIDFTDWTRDIQGLTISGGKGSFTITHDFSVTPLTAGSSLFFNIIPPGARISSQSLIAVNALGGGVGAEISAGLEGDDPILLSAVTLATLNSTPQIFSNISDAATVNRSAIISATVGDITSGVVKMNVEFIV